MTNLKASPWRIIRSNYATYVDARTNRRRTRDYLEFTVAPLAAFTLCIAFDVRLNTGASVSLLTVSGLLGAFLFAVMLQVSQRAMDWADSAPPPSKTTTAHAKLLRELAANAGYSSLVCIASAIAFVVAVTTIPDAQSVTTPGYVSGASVWGLRVSSAVGLGLGVHLIQTLLMVMKRVFAVTEERLNRAETGADRDQSVRHRRAS